MNLLGSPRSSGSGISSPLLVPAQARGSGRIRIAACGPVELRVLKPALGAAAPGKRRRAAEGERSVDVLRLGVAAGGLGPREPEPQREMRLAGGGGGGGCRRAGRGAEADVVARLEGRRRHRNRRRGSEREGLRWERRSERTGRDRWLFLFAGLEMEMEMAMSALLKKAWACDSEKWPTGRARELSPLFPAFRAPHSLVCA